MPEAPLIPEEALQAAAHAVSRMLFSGQPEYGTWLEHDEDLARAAVEAAAPLLAAQVRRDTAKQIETAIATGRKPAEAYWRVWAARLAREIGEAP